MLRATDSKKIILTMDGFSLISVQRRNRLTHDTRDLHVQRNTRHRWQRTNNVTQSLIEAIYGEIIIGSSKKQKMTAFFF